jgi:uncharacterized protein DUF1877
MGMTCTLYRVTEQEIDHLIEEPAGLASLLDPDDGSALRVRTVRPRGLLGLAFRLVPITITEVVSDPREDAVPRVIDRDRSIDIDKGWHGLHFLFTGTADSGDEPACYLVRGGEDLDDEGQARALRPDQVQRFAEYLSTLNPAELTRRYDPARMAKLEIYPDAIWTRSAPTEDFPREWLLECFADLQRFISQVAAANDGVVIHVG